jgi:hypothetical protein
MSQSATTTSQEYRDARDVVAKAKSLAAANNQAGLELFDKIDELIQFAEGLQRERDHWHRRYVRATSESVDDLLNELQAKDRIIANVRKEANHEQERRIYWQGLAYSGMTLVDQLNGHHVTRGQGVTEETFQEAARELNRSRRKLAWQVARADELLEAINELRKDEGDSVTLVADNAEFGGPAAKVVCNGAWTGWNDEDFTGDSMIDALHAAMKIRETRTPDNYPVHREVVPASMGKFQRFGQVFDVKNILRCVVLYAAGPGLGRHDYAWGAVANIAGLGSTSAKKLCLAVGVDPDSGQDLDDLPQPHPLLAAYEEDAAKTATQSDQDLEQNGAAD